jgi:5S rRNA maturation endonuclease (ribonuclease M5)
MEILGLEDVKDRNNWVSARCPFAQWKHEDGVSTRNSFGISVGNPSMFHCFSCNTTGHINQLPMILFELTGNDWLKMREFIYENELKVSADIEPYGETKDLPPHVSSKWMKDMFSELQTYRGLTPDVIKEWGLRFDKNDERVIIPIRDKFGRIVAAKGRAINDFKTTLRHKLYTTINPKDPKAYGIWFGMHYPLVPNKALVLTEGEMDTILLKSTGLVSNVWGVMGVGITREQIATLAAVQNPLLFFFDNDKAGMDLKNRLHMKLCGLSRHYAIMNYFKCKDAGEIVERNLTHAVLASMKKMGDK